MRAVETFIPFAKFQGAYEALSNAVMARDRVQTRSQLLNLVDNYKPSGGLDDLVWKSQNPHKKLGDAANVTEIAIRLGKK